MNQMSNESNTSVASEVTAENIHKILREHTEQEKIFPLDIDTVLIQKEGGALLEVPLPVYIKSQEGFKFTQDEAIEQARILFYRDNRASSHIPYSPEAEEDLSSGQWWLRLIQQVISAAICIFISTGLGALSSILFFAGGGPKLVNPVSTHYGANATDFAYAMLPIAGFFIGVVYMIWYSLSFFQRSVSTTQNFTHTYKDGSVLRYSRLTMMTPEPKTPFEGLWAQFLWPSIRAIAITTVIMMAYIMAVTFTFDAPLR
jgi:hypothetical protein